MVRARQDGGRKEAGRVTGGGYCLGRPVSSLERVPSVALTLPVPPAGESVWHSVSSGILDCYYNVTHLPVGVTVRFRVACSNRAGQGPFSNPSEKVLIRGPQGRWKV